MNKVFLFLFILWIFLFCWILQLRIKRIQREKDIENRYKKAFHRPPDEISKDKITLISEHQDLNSFFSKYQNIVKQSQLASKKERILFIGLIRNKGEQVLSFWPPILNSIGKYFKEFTVIFVENDSEDETRQTLVSFTKKNPNYKVFCPKDEKWNTPHCQMGMISVKSKLEKYYKFEHRLNVLTQLREISLEQIKKFNHYQYAVLIDWDLQGEFSQEGFFHALSLLRKDREMDAVVSNSFTKRFGFYYIFDTFPLFPKDTPCEKIPNQKLLNDIEVLKKYNSTFLSATEPIPIDSGFGGISIYKISSLKEKDPHYDLPERCPYICEHSILNDNLNVVLDPWFTFLIQKNLH